MNTKLYNVKAETIGNIDLPDAVFARPWNADLVHQAVVMYQANVRTPVAHSKDRSEVRGGGRKPWQQKGTGRARHGSSRSPIWVGGGVTFGPRNDKQYGKSMNKKMRRRALAVALSSYALRDALRVVEGLGELEPKTKSLSGLISAFFRNERRPSVLFITKADTKDLYRASRNMPRTNMVGSTSVNAGDVVRYQALFVDKDALTELEKQCI